MSFTKYTHTTKTPWLDHMQNLAYIADLTHLPTPPRHYRRHLRNATPRATKLSYAIETGTITHTEATQLHNIARLCGHAYNHNYNQATKPSDTPCI